MQYIFHGAHLNAEHPAKHRAAAALNNLFPPGGRGEKAKEVQKAERKSEDGGKKKGKVKHGKKRELDRDRNIIHYFCTEQGALSAMTVRHHQR